MSSDLRGSCSSLNNDIAVKIVLARTSFLSMMEYTAMVAVETACGANHSNQIFNAVKNSTTLIYDNSIPLAVVILSKNLLSQAINFIFNKLRNNSPTT